MIQDLSYQKAIESKTIHLHQDDGQSILLWVERLQRTGDLLTFKSSSDKPRTGSGMEEDTFVLLIQTAYQCEMFRSHGESFAGIDATHNTSHYQNTSIYNAGMRLMGTWYVNQFSWKILSIDPVNYHQVCQSHG